MTHAAKGIWDAFTTRYVLPQTEITSENLIPTQLRDGLIGDYDYARLFRPNLPFLRQKQPGPFFGLNDRIPLLLTLLLGFQHALAMLAGIIAPPILIAGPAGANLSPSDQQYLVSSSLIVTGIVSVLQIRRLHLPHTPYYIGTGLISVAGTSFNVVTVATGVFRQMYASGFCPSAPDGTPLACEHGYGAFLGTATVMALWQVLLSFLPPRVLQKIFPPIVTGPTVTLIGTSIVVTVCPDG